MPIDLYYVPPSPPCRAVRLAAKALNLDLNLKLIGLLDGEHLKPDFVKLNPQHTVPTIVEEDGFTLWESRAIMAYLVTKYGKGSGLYPEEPRARALVDQRLYFDIGILYARFADYLFPQLLAGAPADSAKRAKIEDAVQILDTYLEGQKFAAGPNLTIADFSLVTSVTNFEVADVDVTKYPNVKRWLETIKNSAPGYEEINGKGVEAFKALVNSLRKK